MFFRFIYVNYNAWQYARCDTLWAGIITALAEKVEQEFGVFTTRVFRSLSLDLIEKPLFKRHFKAKYLLVEFKKNESSCWSSEDVKRSFEKHGISTHKELAQWIDNEKYDIAIDNNFKKNYWVVEFLDTTKAQEVYEEWQNYDDINVSFLEIPDSLTEAKKNCKKIWNFFKHFGSCLRLNFILLLLATILVICALTTFFTYALVRNSMNNSSKSVSEKKYMLLFCLKQ